MLDSITRTLFISYAREDKSIADTLYAYLKPLIAQGKLRVFIDTEEIEKGEEWHKKITSQLHQADAFLFLVSQHYFRSNYVIDSELPAIIKRYREDQVACWPFLVSDYPWDDFVIDGFHLAGIQAIGPFDDNKRLIPLNALLPPDQDSQFRGVYTEVREWIEKLEREETQKQEALARQQEQKEREEKQRLEQEEEQRKQRERQESERERREQAQQSSAVKAHTRQTDNQISQPTPAGSGSDKTTSAPSYKYFWLVIFGLVGVVFIALKLNFGEQKQAKEPPNVAEQARLEEARRAREETEAQERARAAAEAASKRQAEQVAVLFDRAAQQIDADHLTYPADDNALETIRQAQQIQPDNKRASELLEAILDRYLQWAQDAIVKKEFDKGQQYLDKARRVDADSNRLVEVQNKLDAARRQEVPVLPQPESSSFRDTLSSGGKGPEMVWIPAGSFMMGSPKSETGRDSDEGPQRKVQIRSFALGKTEVTFAEYDRFADATGRKRPDDQSWGRGSRPVINVSWNDAVAYAEWLSGETGKSYRLPSEAEWEYAARAGMPTPFSTGTCITTEQANYDGNYDYAGCGANTGVYRQKTVTTGSLPSNPWELHEVHGNVWEWVQDCYVDSYKGAPSDGAPRVSGACGYRVLRGGSWDFKPQYVRSALRSGDAPAYRNNNVGFRLARTN
ncbi:MAG: SUMF1/EgtB/PvdO family nonheme iron enzyme [Candidatus Thiodiazotropha sp. (ex. Lucinisca nassula)]|nr:SUMF1/EgtB/PvdO family nonheme iron enzyme [Candidatus Thiodiazotropha sp. (ex. Lucinisca nassula)]